MPRAQQPVQLGNCWTWLLQRIVDPNLKLSITARHTEHTQDSRLETQDSRLEISISRAQSKQ